jgi:hypothetical protein
MSESQSVQRTRSRVDSRIRTVGADAEHGTVNGMLPDFRFALGAVLALAMIAVGGLGLVTSVQLVREAHMAPLEESRSLAFAGRAEWNQFYDPEAARRFEGLAGKTEAPVAEARLERPAEASALASPVPAPPVMVPPAITPADPEERTAAIPAHRPEPAPEVAPVHADDKAAERTAEADPPAPQPVAAAPAETAAPNGERIASLPILSPGSDPHGESRTPPPESGPAQPEANDAQPPDSTPPTPRARPKVHFRRRIARVHIRRIPPVAPQPLENSGFPPSPWPGYDTQITGTTATKNAGKLTGR